MTAVVVMLISLLAAEDLTREQARTLKSPIPYSAKSVKEGMSLFNASCTACHGEDGKAEAAIVGSATNLTATNLYKSGSSEGEIFRSIRQGAGMEMPAFQYQGVSEQDAWNLVNFIRSLWPEAQRPKTQ